MSVHEQVIWAEADKGALRALHRQKREWIIPPKQLFENEDYTREEFIAKVSIYAKVVVVVVVVISTLNVL